MPWYDGTTVQFHAALMSTLNFSHVDFPVALAKVTSDAVSSRPFRWHRSVAPKAASEVGSHPQPSGVNTMPNPIITKAIQRMKEAYDEYDDELDALGRAQDEIDAAMNGIDVLHKALILAPGDARVRAKLDTKQNAIFAAQRKHHQIHDKCEDLYKTYQQAYNNYEKLGEKVGYD
jgi:hypothetical protein